MSEKKLLENANQNYLNNIEDLLDMTIKLMTDDRINLPADIKDAMRKVVNESAFVLNTPIEELPNVIQASSDVIH
ncbi:hypothetical protein [Priestia megaterium]|uniref:hypothetical protein n=1 Tax=Priestia megaterium TaxID=1404 RepID=UPI002877D0CF|nr:hypothetical protein [Priestia megaterium]